MNSFNIPTFITKATPTIIIDSVAKNWTLHKLKNDSILFK